MLRLRGPALRPRFFRDVPKYDESVSSKSLADPCARSCQLLIPQLRGFGKSPQKWDWEVSFGIAALQKEIPQGPTAGQASIATGSGTAAGAPAKAATGFKARE